MADSDLTHLDARRFEQALGIVQREQPSAREAWLFQLLYRLVWAAVVLTALYLLLRSPLFGLDVDRVRPVARGVALVYVVVVPVFVLNWRLVNKLRRAARLQRRFAPSWRRRLKNLVRLRRSRRRLRTYAALLLAVLLGTPATVMGGLGLMFELTRDPFELPRLIVAIVMTAFGLSCIFLNFMARGRDRLEAVAELRASLLRGRTDADEGQVSAPVYDAITRIEREHIEEDRRRSVRAATRQALAAQYSAREHRAVRDAKQALPPDVLLKVQACIDRVTASPDGIQGQMRDGVMYVPVSGTALELGFTIDRENREIRILSVTPVTASPLAARQE